MRWPWSKSVDVDEALAGSSRRLAETKQMQASLEPEFEKLRKIAARNHFEEAVTAVFRVAR